MGRRVIASCLCCAALGCAGANFDVGDATPVGLRAWAVASLSRAAAPDVAQPAAVEGPLTLERAVAIALERNLSLLMARQERELADGRITEARSAALPTVGLRGSYMRMDRVMSFSGTDLSALDNYAAVLTLQQPVYLGGRAMAARRMADDNRRAVEHQVAAAEQGITFAVYKNFYDVLLADEDLDAATEAHALASRHLEDVKRRLEQGMTTRFEVTRAEVRVEMAETAAIAARNAAELARTSLHTILGIPLDAKVAVSGELEFAPRDGAVAGAVEAALQRRPELSLQDEYIAMQREGISIVRADRRPTVLVTGEAGWEDPTQMSFGAPDDDTYWRAGLIVNMTLFDGRRVSGKLRQEYARLVQAETARTQLVDQIRLEVTQAQINLDNAQKLVTSQAKVLDQAREALRLAEAGYEQGVSRQLDVLDAQLGLTEARRGYSRAVYGHILAKAALEKATGTFRLDTEKGGAR